MPVIHRPKVRANLSQFLRNPNDLNNEDSKVRRYSVEREVLDVTYVTTTPLTKNHRSSTSLHAVPSCGMAWITSGPWNGKQINQTNPIINKQTQVLRIAGRNVTELMADQRKNTCKKLTMTKPVRFHAFGYTRDNSSDLLLVRIGLTRYCKRGIRKMARYISRHARRKGLFRAVGGLVAPTSSICSGI